MKKTLASGASCVVAALLIGGVIGLITSIIAFAVIGAMCASKNEDA